MSKTSFDIKDSGLDVVILYTPIMVTKIYHHIIYSTG